MYAMPGWGMPGQAMTMQAPTPMRAPAVPAPQPMRTPQATQWQPSLIPQVPAVVRGVAQEAPTKFVLPRPEALGVSSNLTAAPAAGAPFDWNQIQARLERLRVVRYEKDRTAVGVRVTIVLPTSDPTRGQPVEAQAETEAAAVSLVLARAEAWAQRR